MAKVFKGDIGTKLVVDVSIDIATATVKKIFYRKPDGTSGYWTGTLESGNQSLSFTTTATTDLDVVGTWTLQAYIEMPGWSGFGDVTTELIVYETPAAIDDDLTVGTNTWVTMAEAEAYFRTRLGASKFWNNDADKIAALVTAYSRIRSCPDYSIEADDDASAVKQAQFEMALFLLQHQEDMDARQGLQDQGVVSAGIVGESYDKDARGSVVMPANVQALLKEYYTLSPLYQQNIKRRDHHHH